MSENKVKQEVSGMAGSSEEHRVCPVTGQAEDLGANVTASGGVVNIYMAQTQIGGHHHSNTDGMEQFPRPPALGPPDWRVTQRSLGWHQSQCRYATLDISLIHHQTSPLAKMIQADNVSGNPSSAATPHLNVTISLKINVFLEHPVQPSLILRRHTHGLLPKCLMHMTRKI